MRAFDKLKNAAADLLELPKDVFHDVPRVTLVGGLQLFVENHLGILEFSESRIRLAHSGGELQILGKRLLIRYIQPREMLVEGDISEIKWV